MSDPLITPAPTDAYTQLILDLIPTAPPENPAIGYYTSTTTLFAELNRLAGLGWSLFDVDYEPPRATYLMQRATVNNPGDTGIIPLTVPAGWSGNITIRRVIQTVAMTFNVMRVGGSLTNQTTTLTTIPDGQRLRPATLWTTAAAVSSPNNPTLLNVQTDGNVVLPGLSVNNNNSLYGSATYVVVP